MKIFEMRCPSNRIEGNALMLEYKDFTNVKNVARYVRGERFKVVFVPQCYKESFTETELCNIIYPTITIDGIVLANIFYYEN